MAKIFAVNPKKTIPFILKEQKNDPIEDQVIFNIRVCLTAKEKSFLKDYIWLQGESGGYILSGRQRLTALHMALMSIENFTDEDGNEIILNEREGRNKALLHGLYREIKPDVLDAIPDWARDEVASKILGLIDEDVMDEEEREETLKNSQSSPDTHQDT